VLLPAFVPEGLHAPFQRLGWKIILYRIDREGDPDFEDLERLLKAEHPALAILIHYFGLPKPIGHFAELARIHGTLSLEDLAHAYLGESADGPLGTRGDLVLYSLPKMVGVPDGAALVLRRGVAPGLQPPEDHWRHRLYVAKASVDLAIASGARFFPHPLGTFGFKAAGMVLSGNPYGTLMRYFLAPAPMSGLSHRLLGRVDHESLPGRRRALARVYAEKLDREKFPFFRGAAEPTNVMMGFPVTVTDRVRFKRYLAQKAVGGVFWERKWDFIPESERDRHADALWLMRHHYLFPLHQKLAPWQAARVAELANLWPG
jgi:dTDP-4-amino-4,6-dideoxygalactose transaminase